MYNLENAVKYCEKITKEHYENFPVASFLFPKDKRSYIYPIYAFARTADDIADSPKYTEGEKLSMLNDLREFLNGKEPSEKKMQIIFIALHNVISELKLPVSLFAKLLDAFSQDAVKRAYDEFGELLKYSENSANPVGRLVLYVSGYNEKDHFEMFGLSDHICSALQLTNFWQDVSRDLEIERTYIPARIMEKYNYSYKLLYQKVENSDFRNMIRELVDSTEELYVKGNALTNYLKGRLKYELKAIILGGRLILKKIRDIEYKVLSKRIVITKKDKLKLLKRTLFD